MKQIFLNYLCIFILPALTGAVLRLVFMKKQYGWIVSLILGIASAGLLARAVFIPAGGSEAAGLETVQAATAAGCSLICGGAVRIAKKKRKNRED